MRYSIIIPAYRCDSTLEETVRSIQMCGLKDLEIILIDDGSPGGTPDICDRLAEEQRNIRCFHQSNAGVSVARNRGLTEAKGDYVWFFDSDDLVDSNTMIRAAEIIEEHQPDMLIFGMRFEFYRKHTLMEQWDLVYDGEGLFTREELDPIFANLFHCNALSSACNKLIRRELLNNKQIHFCENLFVMEDYHFVLNVLQESKHVYLLPQVIYRYIHQQTTANEENQSIPRAAKIDNIEDYIIPFKAPLVDHPDLLVELYFIFLQQKLSVQKPDEIAHTAEQFNGGLFSKEPTISYCTQAQRALAEKLLSGNYEEIYRDNIKAQTRQRVKRFVKESAIYRAIKGTKPQKKLL